MTEVVVHDGVIAATGDGNGSTIDFGEVSPGVNRRVDGKQTILVRSTSDSGGDFFIWRLVFGDTDSFPVTVAPENRSIPRDETDVTDDQYFDNIIFPNFGLTLPARHAKASFIVIGSMDCKVTVFFDETVIVQTFPVPAAGANTYVTAIDAILRLAIIAPSSVSFGALAADRQDAVLVLATRRIENEVVRLCQPAGSSTLDALQTLLWGRLEAYSAVGVLIVTILQSWIDAILLYAAEIGEAELLGEEPEEPAEDKGLVEVELDAESAKYSERWPPEGAPGDFFQSRARIFSLLSESFPFGGVR